MANRRVLSFAAEQARTDLRLILAEHQRSRRASSMLRPGRMPLAGGDPERRSRELSLSGLVAVAENFFVHILLETVPGIDEIAISNWRKREEVLREHHSVDPRQSSNDYGAVCGFAEARNAILHGLGHLTRMQQRPNRLPRIKQDLAAAGIGLDRTRVLIEEAELVACTERSCLFISWLDLVCHS
jgi:hypothetical protein